MTEEEFRNGQVAQQNMEAAQSGTEEIGEEGVTGNGEATDAAASTVSESDVGNGDATSADANAADTSATDATTTTSSTDERDTSRDLEGLHFVASVNVYRSTEDGQFFIRYDDETREANGAANASAVGILASQYLADKANFELQSNPLK